RRLRRPAASVQHPARGRPRRFISPRSSPKSIRAFHPYFRRSVECALEEDGSPISLFHSLLASSSPPAVVLKLNSRSGPRKTSASRETIDSATRSFVSIPLDRRDTYGVIFQRQIWQETPHPPQRCLLQMPGYISNRSVPTPSRRRRPGHVAQQR
ncbi:unnamed protein product, partial [Callosobruchus maculatus]